MPLERQTFFKRLLAIRKQSDSMPVAHNMEELERMLQKELYKAMNIVAGKILEIMTDATEDFYSGGEPKQYERTGELGQTPRITRIKQTGNEISFGAYLKSTHQYTTGKNPNMLQVLLLTNDMMTKQPNIGKLQQAVGSPHFWDRALQIMEKEYNNVLSNFFTKM